MVLFLNRLCLFLASGFGLGFLAFAIVNRVRRNLFFSLPPRWHGAGFLGTLLGFAMVSAGTRVHYLPGFILLIGGTVLSIVIAHRAEYLLQSKDASQIVIDEIAGYFWAIALLPVEGLPARQKIIIFSAAFVLFRIFDVFKLPFKQAQNFKGGLGIVLDDVLAGILTNIILQISIRSIL